jgi:hypothetical protein
VQDSCYRFAYFLAKTVASLADKSPPRLIVIPAKAGIHRQHEAWIPAFAGMTIRFLETSRTEQHPWRLL